ncbi:iron-containing redox enzyme family protein [Dietzia sp. SLG310A2-38A2]|uniref:iron-containing redox enzyme family protein n=1 Tax=Dietzia sp. SLG310A2-38A2 TaxID=1630643 RepID=UPI0015FC850B|nr:iron-containing redox enzyme family protein [Dietzia sp. SLG310A2-38A2]MBB1030039.1 iron-containing redox enzyme family protein [Dietzia sp. SLG310A2-38A2]
MTAVPTQIAPSASAPTLPAASGPISEAVVTALATGRTDGLPGVPADTDPLGRDLQLALYTLYELHYRGFDGVDADLEWDPELLRLRRALESLFLDHLRGAVEPGDDPVAEMDALSVEATSGTGPSWYFKDEGTWDQLREYFAHRSLYHLKEGDPHAFAIPRLQGQAKASFVAVEFDEFGGGRGERVHQQLWADLMRSAELDPTYLGYLDRVSAATLSTVNLMSLFGLHRSLRGAAIGHFAAIEITSSPGSARLVAGLRRMGAPEECVHFYAEHVEADAVHEQVMRHDVVGDLVSREPQLAADVVFGMRTLDYLDELAAGEMLAAWGRGDSSLLP